MTAAFDRPESLSVRFTHGLGDCANFAHVVELYRRHGVEIAVQCSPDKAPLFALRTLVSSPVCKWWNGGLATPVSAGLLRANKIAFNIDKDVLPAVPGLTKEECWRELSEMKLSLPAPSPEQVEELDRFIASCPRPLVLWHPHANTDAPIKSYTERGESLAITHALLDAIGHGTVVLLDWDDRVPRVPSARCRHIADGDVPRDVLSLAYLIGKADLLVGVDSGPLHLARFTDTPALGVWKAHHPAFYSLPRKQTVNLVPRAHGAAGGWDRLHRCEFQTVLSAYDQPSAVEIADLAADMLIGHRYSLATAGQLPAFPIRSHHVFVDRLIARTRSSGASISNYVDRNVTFGMVANHLRAVSIVFDRSPVMVETGCIRSPEDWGGAGYSTFLFGALFRSLGRGKLYSVELNPRNCDFAREACKEVSDFVSVHRAHSHDWLTDVDGPQTIDVFYSDSLDTTSPGHEENCLREVQLALPRMAADGLILIDDTVRSAGRWVGKGETAIPWLQSQGWKILYSGYQCLLGRANA